MFHWIIDHQPVVADRFLPLAYSLNLHDLAFSGRAYGQCFVSDDLKSMKYKNLFTYNYVISNYMTCGVLT